MSRIIDYVVEGTLKDGNKVDFVKDKLAVHAFVSNKEMAHAAVDDRGHYRLTFKYEDEPPNTQLRITPARFPSAVERLALSDTFAPNRYLVKGDVATAQQDLAIPSQYIETIKSLDQKYQFHGEVYSATIEGGEIQYLEIPPSAMKIDFYLEEEIPLPVVGTGLPIHPEFPQLSPLKLKTPVTLPRPAEKKKIQLHLGYAYSSPTGGYEFDFKLAPGKLAQASRTNPVVTAKLSQLVNATWTQIYQDQLDWHWEKDLHKDFFVPKQDFLAVPDPGQKPATGFLFTHLGLLPIDDTRIDVNGYATSVAGDPVTLQCQPFCCSLRVSGLFAESPPVAAYKVQVAKWDETTSSLGTWEDITDQLADSYWDESTSTWISTYLGPNPLPTGLDPTVFSGNFYRNVDNDPHIWNQYGLKFVWNSAQKNDGLYALQVIGYDASGQPIALDASGNPVGYQMPKIRVANTVPQAGLEATIPSPGICGCIKLTDSTITFNVVAYDPDGHVFSYEVYGTRGKDGLVAGNPILESRPDPTKTWTGTASTGNSEDFEVTPLAVGDPLAACPALAYGFWLLVQGSGTDGTNALVTEQQAWKWCDLVVMK